MGNLKQAATCLCCGDVHPWVLSGGYCRTCDNELRAVKGLALLPPDEVEEEDPWVEIRIEEWKEERSRQ